MKNQLPIIPVSSNKCEQKSWKVILKEAVATPRQLLAQLNLSPESLGYAIDENSPFKTRVPQPFIDKMQKGDPNDPLLLQVLAQGLENQAIPNYTSDPLEEQDNATHGLLHKYHGRVLLILSSACAVNCRYCFRRHFPYQEQNASGQQLLDSLNYIQHDSSITEVILSGGDPLILDDTALEGLVEKLDNISHLKRLRIHTRLPIVIPQRVTEKLCAILSETRLSTSMVLHINHAHEVDKRLKAHLTELAQTGTMLLNQSVLLKGVNDDARTLCALSEALFESKVIPYYLHVLDKVSGAAHFDVNEKQAVEMIAQMRSMLPGYLVPRLAREEAKRHSKTVLA